MSIDRQRIAAVKILEAMGFAWSVEHGWRPALARVVREPILAEADAMYSLLMERADKLIGAMEGTAEQNELAEIGEAIEAYEAVRWPDGKADGGNG
jgi:hypothetical protein